MPSYEEIQGEALRLLGELRRSPALPLEKKMRLPGSQGIYILIRHSTGEILYLGKATSLLRRFAGGHKAFGWAYIDRIPIDEVGVCCIPIPRSSGIVLSELEGAMLRAVKPPYNEQIPKES